MFASAQARTFVSWPSSSFFHAVLKYCACCFHAGSFASRASGELLETVMPARSRAVSFALASAAAAPFSAASVKAAANRAILIPRNMLRSFFPQRFGDGLLLPHFP